MVHATNKEKYPSINGIAIAERASLVEVVDRLSPYLSIFISPLREDDDYVRDTSSMHLSFAIRTLRLDNHKNNPPSMGQP